MAVTYRLFIYLLFCITLSSTSIASSMPDHEIEAPGSGKMTLIPQNAIQSSPQDATLIESELSIKASGMIAMLELTQHFENTSNAWVEGRYVFPLPEDAAVDAFEIQIGQRIIKGVIKEKQQAKKTYQSAKLAGKKAALLEQQRPNIFSQSIANIAPQEKITIKLRYLQKITYQHDTFSLRFPMTITPRYISKSPNSHQMEDHQVTINNNGWGTHSPTPQVPDAHLITPPMSESFRHETENIPNPISINIQLDAGLPLALINSPYHNIAIKKSNQQHHITLARGQVSMDRDFVLSWKTIPSATPTAAIFNETVAGDDYSLLMLMPPQYPHTSTPSSSTIPKEIIFIIDTSGSMGGTSIRQAKEGLSSALQQLNENDRFNIIEFNSDYSLFRTQPVIATPSNIQQSLKNVDALYASGGTEILPALLSAFNQKTTETHLKQIIFLTDGSVGNENKLLETIHKEINNSRLFTVGIGSAPNSFFMRKAAEIGRGHFTYIADTNEVQEKINQLFTQISQPMMQDILIKESADNKNKSISPLEIFPSLIPDLYRQQPIIITIRKDYQLSNITIKGTFNKQPWQQTLTLNHGKQHAGVAKLWARDKIEHLLDKQRVAPHSVQETLKNKILSTALRHQLMSPYTSFIAVEEKISRPNNQKLTQHEIANQMAKGQNIQAVAYPQTATPFWIHVILGSLSLMGILLYRYRQNFLIKKVLA